MSVGTQTGHLTQTWERKERLLSHPDLGQKERLERSKREKEKQFGTAGTACAKAGWGEGEHDKIRKLHTTFPTSQRFPFLLSCGLLLTCFPKCLSAVSLGGTLRASWGVWEKLERGFQKAYQKQQPEPGASYSSQRPLGGRPGGVAM